MNPAWAVLGGLASLCAIAGVGWRGLKWLQRVDAKLGTPNGRGSVSDMLTQAIVNAEQAKIAAAEAKSAASEFHADTTLRFDSQDKVLRDQDEALRKNTETLVVNSGRIERLERGQVETHQLIVGLTNAQAQSAVALAMNGTELARLTASAQVTQIERANATRTDKLEVEVLPLHVDLDGGGGGGG